MIDETSYKGNKTGDTGNTGVLESKLHNYMINYMEIMHDYTSTLPENEREPERKRLYNTGLALYFSFMGGVITQDYRPFYKVLEAATQYHLEKAGLAGIVNKHNAEEQILKTGNGTPELRVLTNERGFYGC